MRNEQHIPSGLKQLSQWVCATNDNKIPWQANGVDCASSSNPNTWCSFTEARDAVDAGLFDYCGFVFADNGLVGIDIDAGFDEYGIITPLAVDIILHCGGYVEKSKSGRGFHIIVKGDLPFKGKNNLAGVEIYKTARYFIVTGDYLKGYEDITDNQNGVEYVLKTYFTDMLRDAETKSIAPVIYKPVWEYKKGDIKVPIRPNYPEIESGNRNLSLTSLAGQMHTVGYDKSMIYSELLRVNSKCCHPPLNTNEIRQICNSITRYRRD